MNVVITGASRGLGAALARAFAARRHRVFLVARNEADLDRVAESITLAGHERPMTFVADLRDVRACAAAIATAETQLGQIDTLINNAGAGTYKPLGEWSEQELLDVISLNLTAVMLLTRAALPPMLARRSGQIINVASDLAKRPLANMAPYVASKYGLLGFSASMHREVRGHGLRVATVMPGIIDTAFNGAQEGSKIGPWALRPDAVAAQIVQLAELPKDMAIDEMVIHPLEGDY